MAKLSSINKNERRKALVKKYAAKYASLKAVADDRSADETERLIARLKLAEIPVTGTRPACATVAQPPAARAATIASSACAALSCVILPTGHDPRRDEVELVRNKAMALTDPLGDMLTRIRNGQQAKKDSVLSPASKLRSRVLEVLQREGYIRGYSEDATGVHPQLRIELKYFEGEPRSSISLASQAGSPCVLGQQRTARGA
jgi:hypothetical protein